MFMGNKFTTPSIPNNTLFVRQTYRYSDGTILDTMVTYFKFDPSGTFYIWDKYVREWKYVSAITNFAWYNKKDNAGHYNEYISESDMFEIML